MNLIDSSGWLEYFMNGPLAESYADYVSSPAKIVTPTIVIYEVYKNIKAQVGEEEALLATAQMKRTHIVPLSTTVALQAADVSLEQKLPMADAIIYATARAYSARLITSDADFAELPDVTYLPNVEE